jgi:hypothetical protein
MPEEPLGPLGSRPRLSDWYDLPLDEQELDFVIPRLREDIPLNLDPFLLFNSSNREYVQLHEAILDFFEQVRVAALAGREMDAIRLLEGIGEPVELGLGYSTDRARGRALGPKLRADIVTLFASVPQLLNSGLTHIEALGLLVENLAEDRISDITGSLIKSYLARFTEDQARTHRLPVCSVRLDGFYDSGRGMWTPKAVALPFNPVTNAPLMFAPRDLLRHLPFINYDDYYKSTYAPLVLPPRVRARQAKPVVLQHNRQLYSHVEVYLASKEQRAAECRPKSLFQPLGAATLRAKLRTVKKLPTGRDGGVDKEFERLAEALLTSLLFPELEYADSQVRTISGAHIRDLIFYNDSKTQFTGDLRSLHDCRQLVVEFKNVATLDGSHVTQLARYLTGAFGSFGILLSRNTAPRSVLQNTVDLHSSTGKIVLCLSDSDLELMVECYSSGPARRPIEVVKRAYIHFMRMLPS